jgi:hypothetical protein
VLSWISAVGFSAEPAPPPAPAPGPPPNQGLVISVEAGGRLLVGHVVADAAFFAKHGITFWTEAAPISDPTVGLVHGVRILGLPQGERLVEDAFPTLMYFDANGDPYVDAGDPLFAGLSLFVDADADGKIDAGEVRPFTELVEYVSKFGKVEARKR